MGAGGFEDGAEEMDAAQREVVECDAEDRVRGGPSLEHLLGAALDGGEVGKQRGCLGIRFGPQLGARRTLCDARRTRRRQAYPPSPRGALAGAEQEIAILVAFDGVEQRVGGLPRRVVMVGEKKTEVESRELRRVKAIIEHRLFTEALSQSGGDLFHIVPLFARVR